MLVAGERGNGGGRTGAVVDRTRTMTGTGLSHRADRSFNPVQLCGHLFFSSDRIKMGGVRASRCQELAISGMGF